MKPIMQTRFIVILLLVLQISSCAWFTRNNDCVGDNCDTPKLLKTKTTNKKWYCYGKSDSEHWDCVDKPAPEKITAINPQVEQPAPAPLAQAPTKQAVQPLYDGTQTILNEPKDHYTVQLIALTSKKGIEDYAMIHGVTSPMYVYIKDPNQPMYILLLGTYADQDKALDAKERWQRTHQLKEEPWVRKLGPLQDAINKADKN